MKIKIYLLSLLWCISCAGFSSTYFYELYLHNEYFAEPPGFPSKFILSPLLASFTGHGNHTDLWHEKRFSAALVAALRLTHNHTWIELIGAFGKERVRFNHEGVRGRQSHFGLDDFLIDIGHNFLVDEKGKFQILVHWLTGIPLKWKVTLAQQNDTLVGTRTFATGPVIEWAYDFIRTVEYDVFVGFIGRFMHRFKRSYQPILPPGAIFNPGNQIDLLMLGHYRHYGHNLEIGYVASLYIHQSYQLPDSIERLPSGRYNSIYFDYSYYHDKLAMSFEFNITKIFGRPYEGIAAYFLIGWYF